MELNEENPKKVPRARKANFSMLEESTTTDPWSLRDEPYNFKWEGICYLVFEQKLL
jgi:hypothetical protein